MAFHFAVLLTTLLSGMWDALEKLNALVDESDPDVGFGSCSRPLGTDGNPSIKTDLTQIGHALQTAEAIRRDGKPEWMQVVGLVHDVGKLLYLFGSE